MGNPFLLTPYFYSAHTHTYTIVDIFAKTINKVSHAAASGIQAVDYVYVFVNVMPMQTNILPHDT